MATLGKRLALGLLLLAGAMACAEPAFARGAKRVPLPIPPAPPLQEHGSFVLRVMTYNIKGLPFPGVGHDRYAEIGRVLADKSKRPWRPHIVALQEAFYYRVEELVQNAGYRYVVGGPGPDFPRFGSGLVILSDLPILTRTRHAFNEATSFEVNVRKGAMIVQVRIPGLRGGVQILNTHLQSNPDGDPTTTWDETVAVRGTQIREIGAFVRANIQPNIPFIAVGDFNTARGRSDGHYPMLLKALEGLQDVADAPVLHSSAVFDWSNSIDRQFYRSGLDGVRRIKALGAHLRFDGGWEPVLSDHRAREVRYRLEW